MAAASWVTLDGVSLGTGSNGMLATVPMRTQRSSTPVPGRRSRARRSDLAGDNAEQRLGDAKPDARDGFRSLS
jgi:hypothetical protein